MPARGSTCGYCQPEWKLTKNGAGDWSVKLDLNLDSTQQAVERSVTISWKAKLKRMLCTKDAKQDPLQGPNGGRELGDIWNVGTTGPKVYFKTNKHPKFWGGVDTTQAKVCCNDGIIGRKVMENGGTATCCEAKKDILCNCNGGMVGRKWMENCEFHGTFTSSFSVLFPANFDNDNSTHIRNLRDALRDKQDSIASELGVKLEELGGRGNSQACTGATSYNSQQFNPPTMPLGGATDPSTPEPGYATPGTPPSPPEPGPRAKYPGWSATCKCSFDVCPPPQIPQ